jgi:hypothetical protein
MVVKSRKKNAGDQSALLLIGVKTSVRFFVPLACLIFGGVSGLGVCNAPMFTSINREETTLAHMRGADFST